MEDLRYPNRKINEADDYLQIRIIQYKEPGLNVASDDNLSFDTSTDALKKSGNIESPLANIFLPMPQGITDSNEVTWGEDSITGFAAKGFNVAGETLRSRDLTKGVYEGVMETAKAFEQLSQNKDFKDLAVAKFSADLVNSIGGNTSFTGLLARTTGKILNPHMELLFNNVTLRQFSFTFNLTPRDRDEAIKIKKIINILKRSSAAKSGGSSTPGSGLFIGTPDVFQLTYKSGSGDHPFLNKFKPMALTSMAVNYAASGPYATYTDSTPVYMTLDLKFQELNPIYSEDYDDPEILGVGY